MNPEFPIFGDHDPGPTQSEFFRWTDEPEPQVRAMVNRILELYDRAIATAAHRLTPNHELACDVAGDVVLSLARSLVKFKYDPRKGRFRAYLVICLRHALVQRMKKDGRLLVNYEPEELEALMLRNRTVQDDLVEHELRLQDTQAAVSRILGGVSALHRHVFCAAVHDERPMAEVAQAFGVSKDNGYQIVKRIRDAIRRELRRMDDEPMSGDDSFRNA